MTNMQKINIREQNKENEVKGGVKVGHDVRGKSRRWTTRRREMKAWKRMFIGT